MSERENHRVFGCGFDLFFVPCLRLFLRVIFLIYIYCRKKCSLFFIFLHVFLFTMGHNKQE